MSKPILCVDFDGVIHSYSSGWKGACEIPDPPVEGSIAWLLGALKFWDVQIYSSRTKEVGGIEAMEKWLTKWAREEFERNPFRDSVGECVIIFMGAIKLPSQKPPANLTIDDHAITFEGKWSDLDPEELLKFKPWNKR